MRKNQELLLFTCPYVYVWKQKDLQYKNNKVLYHSRYTKEVNK